MIETNVRIVAPGMSLYILVREATLIGTDITPEIVEKACNKLVYRDGLVAVPYEDKLRQPTILVATTEPIKHVRLSDDSWEVEVADGGKPSWRLTLKNEDGQRLIPLLVERALNAKIRSTTNWWAVDGPGLWCEGQPFKTVEDINAYNRYEIGALYIEDVGVGVAVDIGTVFYTQNNLAYYFDGGVNQAEQHRRRDIFERITERQSGHKGTLLYDIGVSQHKCYLATADTGQNCATTGTIRIDGHTFSSLENYYQTKYENLKYNPNGLAARVSFKGIDKSVWAAAELLRARVNNEALHGEFQHVDKLTPTNRRNLIKGFWQELGSRPLGTIAPGVNAGFWRPSSENVKVLRMPDLAFGKDTILSAPKTLMVSDYKENFYQRIRYLNQYGCYHTPPAMDRTIYFAYPEEIDSDAATEFGNGLAELIGEWTHLPINFKPVPYKDVQDAAESLKGLSSSGVVMFILDEDPATYYQITQLLTSWRVKRATRQTFGEFYNQLKKGAYNKRTQSFDLHLGNRNWKSMIEKNALEMVQLFEVIPYRPVEAGSYEAQLVIDVSYNYRHFAISLLLMRDRGSKHDFRLRSQDDVKTDQQAEAINRAILRDQIVKLFDMALPGKAVPLKSLLVIRDGKFCGQEVEGIDQALEILTTKGKICPESERMVHMAELHKSNMKHIRFWNINDKPSGYNGSSQNNSYHKNGFANKSELEVTNPLEGTVVKLGKKQVLLAVTGAATLHQGTADPLMLVGNGRCPDVDLVAQTAFLTAQMNWSSPTTAQKLPLAVRHTDEVLQIRVAQEIRRLD